MSRSAAIVDMGLDKPIKLAEACRVFFDDQIKPATLRAEARRGRLEIERIGHTDFVTARAIAEMRRKCRLSASAPDSGSGRPVETSKPDESDMQPGSSSIEDDTSPRDALSEKVRRLTNA